MSHESPRVPSTAPSARKFGLLGAPTSAGSHNPGQDRAPTAWRDTGFVEQLRSRVEVTDHGDLDVQRHRPHPRVDGVRARESVAGFNRTLADRLADIAEAGDIPIVIGGDCTITLGLVAGLARTTDIGVLYFDGDADLNTPATSDSGILDTMGVTHLLGGGVPGLVASDERYPLLEPTQIELFGFDPAELDAHQWLELTNQRLQATPAPTVRSDPAAAAAAAWARLSEHCDRILLHVDVDVLDTGAFPLANFPHFNGLSLAEVATCLDVFCANDNLAAITITEINPDHDTDGALVNQLADVLLRALVPS